MDAWIWVAAALALGLVAAWALAPPLEKNYEALQDVTHEKGGNLAYVRALIPNLPKCAALRSIDAWRLPAPLRRELVAAVCAALRAGQLPALRALTLHELAADDAEALAAADLSLLEELRVPRCDDPAPLLAALPEGLLALDVSDCGGSPLLPSPLPERLHTLVLDGVEVPDLAAVCRSLHGGVRCLQARRAGLKHDVVPGVLELIARSPQLRVFRLGSNPDLPDPAVAQLLQALAAGAPELEVLDLGGTGASNETPAALAAAMARLPCLRELHMRDVCYGKAGVLTIVDALAHVPQLRKLVLWTNRVAAAEREALSQTIKEAAERHTKVEGFRFS